MPLAVSDCLNFGSPEDPGVMWQFAEACRGLKDACVALGIPVTGGNVSLYNQTGETAILPTPVVAVLGVIDDVRRRTPTGFAGPRPGHRPSRPDPGGALGLGVGARRARSPRRPAAAGRPARRGQPGRLLVEAGRGGYVTSAHDMSEGGLSQALVESCLRHGVGATVSLLGDPFVGLFSESAGRAIVTVPEDRLDSFLTMAASLGVPAGPVGRTGGSSFTVTDHFAISLDELGAAWRGTLRAAFGNRRAMRGCAREPTADHPGTARTPLSSVSSRCRRQRRRASSW